MSFPTPPAFEDAPLDSSTQQLPGSPQINIGFDQVAQLIKPVRGKSPKVNLLGANLPVAHLQEPTDEVPLVFTIRRANYDFAVAVWRNRVLVEVRIKENPDPRGYTWPRTIEELHAVLQTIVNDTVPGQTVGDLGAFVPLSRASWDMPTPPRHPKGDTPGQIIEHSRSSNRGYVEPTSPVQHGFWEGINY